MKRVNLIYYALCLAVPHVMLLVGLIFLARRDVQYRLLGKHICITSSVVLAVGSILYYIFFTPMFGLD